MTIPEIEAQLKYAVKHIDVLLERNWQISSAVEALQGALALADDTTTVAQLREQFDTLLAQYQEEPAGHDVTLQDLYTNEDIEAYT